MEDVPPRFVPQRPLPPYTYVPGRFPHPEHDPAGHSYGHVPAPAVPLEPDNWPASREYLYGLDLFNAGYYWEAHEAWESLWHAAGRQGPAADFLKGLIKLAAAGVKLREGRREGLRRHAARALELFISVQQQTRADRYCGLLLSVLIIHAQHLPERVIDFEPDAQVTRVFNFVLLPGE